MRACSICKTFKPLSEFYKNAQDKKTGKQGYCKSCSSKRVRARSQANRDVLWKIKEEKGCERCGFNAHPAALQFNHIDPATKSFGIGDNTMKQLDILLAEVEKCEVLCANCHAIHTYKTHQTRHHETSVRH